METKKSTFGLDKNIARAATYIGFWVTGLIFLFGEKNDQDIRFNAAQSLVFFGGLTLISLIPLLGQLLMPFTSLVALAGWLVLLVKSYQGETFRLPVVAEYADKVMKKI